MRTRKYIRPERVDLIYWHELTASEQLDFDWIKDPENSGEQFFRYQDRIYCLSEFMRFDKKHLFDGYLTDSFFSAVLIKFQNNNALYNDYDQALVAIQVY